MHTKGERTMPGGCGAAAAYSIGSRRLDLVIY